jgi:hypothetical protein
LVKDMLPENSDLGNLENSITQESDLKLYKYDVSYYLNALIYMPGLILFSFITYESVQGCNITGALMGGGLLLYNLFLILNFATRVVCDDEGITVSFIFLYKRSMKWNEIRSMRLKLGSIPICRIFSKGFSFPITFNLTPPGTLADKKTLLATIRR